MNGFKVFSGGKPGFRDTALMSGSAAPTQQMEGQGESVNRDEIKRIIANDENERTEFKESFGDEAIISLVSFANARGGQVIVGVNRKKKIIGASISSESVQGWVNEVKTKTFRELSPLAEMQAIGGKTVVALSVLEHPIKPVSFKGKFFVRRNNSNHAMSAHEIAEEVNRLKSTSLDSAIMEKCSMDDLDFKEINRVIGKINLRKDGGTKLQKNPKDFLVKYNLMEEDKLTLAALLLFGKNYDHNRVVQAGVFQSDMVIKDELVCEDFLARQVDELFEFVKKHISKMTFILPQPENVQRWEYPLEALRELITNMVVHRDYRQTASIRIYPDKIIFSNYGGLPAGFTVEDFINGKAPSYLSEKMRLILIGFPTIPVLAFSKNAKPTTRYTNSGCGFIQKMPYTFYYLNKFIAKVFKEANIIEEYSSGLKRVNKAFKKNDSPPPEFFVNPQSFTVFAKSINLEALQENQKGASEDSHKTVKKTIQKLLAKISENPETTISGLAKATGLSNIGVRYNLKKLKKSRVIKRVGPDKGGYWEITG